MTTEEITNGATVEEGAVRSGTQYEVEANKGVCYLDQVSGQGSTEFGFLPCDASYNGEIVVRQSTINDAATVNVQAERGEQVVIGQSPADVTLPETGSEPIMLGIGSILLIMGMGLRKLAHR